MTSSGLTYAVGDVHGCLGMLDELLASIERDAAGGRHRLVFVGDYIDRGPDSAGVIGRLRGLQAAGRDVVCLKGNHEDLMLRALREPAAIDSWLYNGGRAALDSFGVAAPRDLPADVIAWVEGCPTVFEDRDRCYVHAGLDPTRPLSDQTDRDRLWIRDAFLSVEHDFGKYVVHGHTPRIDGRPDVRRHRVNIDTAAIYGGALTAAIFDDSRAAPVGFLQATG